jgi:hypothetical protein
MFKSRVLTGALVAGSVGVASLFAAAPASAATLPDGQKITVVDSFDQQFYYASPADASLTAVGGPNNIEVYLQGIDVDDDGAGYAVGTDYSEGPQGGYVYAANAATGVMGLGIQVTVNFGDVLPDVDGCTAIDYSGGVILASCFILFQDGEVGPLYPVNYIGVLDPVTGVLQPDLEFPAQEDFADDVTVNAIASDPVGGGLWVFTTEYPDGVVYGAYEYTVDLGFDYAGDTLSEIFGADFDRGGQLWLTTEFTDGGGEFPPSYPALATINLTSGSYPFAEFMTIDALPVESQIEPVTVWGKLTLPATGPADSAGIALGAAGFLLLGAFLAAVTVLRRRSVEG